MSRRLILLAAASAAGFGVASAQLGKEVAVVQVAIYFLIWGALIFFMMRFGCGAHVMGHGHGDRHESNRPDGGAAQGGGARSAPPVRDIDPVCGMTVETAGAKSSVYGGRVYYFCSQDCREKFEAAPQTYVNRSATPQAAAGGHHGAH